MTQLTSRDKPIVFAAHACVLALSVVFASGCSGGGAAVTTGTTSGKVTFDGAPVKAGQVVFENADSTAPKPNQLTMSFTDGNYAAGALVVGTYNVHVLPAVAVPGQPEPTSDDIPEKYRTAATSGLTTKIKTGPNTFDIPMTK